jgi:hypothetical protein
MPDSIGGLFFTSNRISRLFLSGPAEGGIEKMRSIFFQKTKSSGVPVIPPSGGTGSEAKATRQKGCVQYITKSIVRLPTLAIVIPD